MESRGRGLVLEESCVAHARCGEVILARLAVASINGAKAAGPHPQGCLLATSHVPEERICFHILHEQGWCALVFELKKDRSRIHELASVCGRASGLLRTRQWSRMGGGLVLETSTVADARCGEVILARA